ncbi:MAG TPA: hypothetical protein VF254_02085 [Gammaproteobacteria bacterium]
MAGRAMKRSRQFTILLFATAMPLLGGCAATVVPPADPADPRPAFILDHGRHATLVVVDSSGRPVRYAFAETNTDPGSDFGFFRGLGALLVPDSGMLGRRVLPGSPTAQNILATVGMTVENLYCIAVSGERANRLQRVLNLVFEKNLATATHDPDWNLEFVEHPEDYWFGDDPNQAVENWLIELDCDVSGITSFGDWKIERPAGELPAVCAEGSRKSKVESRK